MIVNSKKREARTDVGTPRHPVELLQDRDFRTMRNSEEGDALARDDNSLDRLDAQTVTFNPRDKD